MDPSPRRPLREALDVIHAEAAAALGILREAPWIAARNWRLSLPALLLVLLPSSLLSLCHQFLFDPPSFPARAQPVHAVVLRGLAAHSPSPSGLALADANILVFADFGLLLAYWLLDLFEVTVTVFGAAAAYREDRPGLGELFRRIRRDWRGPVATRLCVTALRTGYWGVLDAFADALVPLAAGPTSLLLMALGSLLFLAGNLVYHYFDVAWEASLAATAVDNCGGYRALGLAGEITEGRRWLRGVVMGLLYLGASEAASLIFELVLELAMAESVHAALIVVFSGVFEVMYMYKLAAFIVFYCKCRGSRWEEGGHYSRLPGSPPS